MNRLKMEQLPAKKEFQTGIRRAPRRELNLTPREMRLAVSNALRYIPKQFHAEMAQEFMDELIERGRIYGYRFRPEGKIFAKPVEAYQGKTLEGKAFQLMMDNNLDFDVALYPYELVTYGETGQVCQNWMQYLLIQQYLREMTDTQTLVVMSGHPLGLFPSKKESPRVIITNSLMVGCYDDQENWKRAAALGVANYGQMTAGGWMYIGPQGIVHGTYNTLLNAGRLKLGLGQEEDLKGKLFISSGLGGMSGAQGKAAHIAGAVGIIAEVDESRIKTRLTQGWVDAVAQTKEEAFAIAQEYLNKKEAKAVAFHGNIVDLLEYAVEKNIFIHLLSDQTSCHAVYDGGYCPWKISFEERTRMLAEDKAGFVEAVNRSLRKHYELIKTLVRSYAPIWLPENCDRRSRIPVAVILSANLCASYIAHSFYYPVFRICEYDKKNAPLPLDGGIAGK